MPPFLTGVSPNGHYTVDQSGQPFLVNADTPWNLAWGLNSTDQTTYLSTRQSEGFNTMVLDLVGNANLFGNANGANWNGEVPFTGGNFATPNNTYWSRIDSFFSLCQTYGISVIAFPLDAYATQTGQVFVSMTGTQAQAYGSFLASRYPTSSYPGIVWAVGNDYAADGTGTGCCSSTPVPATYASLLTGLGSSRLITGELGFYETLPTDGTVLGPLMTLNASYSYHPTYQGVLRGRALGAIPVFHLEGAYENTTGGYPATALDIRKQPLWSLTSGGTGQTYGNDNVWMFPTGWQSTLSTTDVTQRAALFAAFNAINWWKLNPDVSNQLVTAGRNTQYITHNAGPSQPWTNDATYGSYVTAAFAADGSLAVIYNPNTSVNSITVSSSVLATNPIITAVDPTNGATTNLGWTTTPTMGANAGGDHDWLFVINAQVFPVNLSITAQRLPF